METLPNEKQPSTDELLDAEAHLWNHIFSFINPMCLKCAIELGIPDIVHKHGKPMTLSKLTEALNINESKSLYVDRLMRVLVHAKFFTTVTISEEEDDGGNNKGFILTPSYLPLLIRDHDMSIVPFAMSMLDHHMINQWHIMSRWFQNDNDPATLFLTCHGKTFWDFLGLNPRLGSLFNKGMSSDTNLVSRIVPKDCKTVFEGVELLVDVGGGTGHMAKAISDEISDLKCIVLDLPQVVDGLKGDDKVTFIGGDMFESIPPCDAVFLKWMLHDWSDEDCLKLLRKCKEAIHQGKGGKGGKVFVIDMVVREDRKATLETQLFFDMLMMVLLRGKERTEKDWAKLFYEAGFTSYKITPLLGVRSLIEVFP